MNDQTDSQLLRVYAEGSVEPAFAELVRRHVDFVYSAALRMIRDPHLAEDVTQGVFTALAKNAPHLADRSRLSGWLHQTTRNIAAGTVRTIERRRAREQEAVIMNQLLSAPGETTWEQIAPYLDNALGELSETDHHAVLLRYFERKSASEIAQILGISDEAAQKRVSRAVERLREFFAKHGITVGASGLIVLISANAVQAAPAGLATAITAGTVLTETAIPTSTVITSAKTIAMTASQKILIAATFAVLAGAGIYEAHQASQMHKQNQALQGKLAPLAEQIQQLQRERDEATNQLAGLLTDIKNLKSAQNSAELLKLRGLVGMLRDQLASATNISTTTPAPQPSTPTHPAWALREPRRIAELQNVGTETPAAIAETVLWAASHNATNLLDLVSLPENVLNEAQQQGITDILIRVLGAKILIGASAVKDQSDQVWLDDGSTTDLVSPATNGVPGTNIYAGVVSFHLSGGNANNMDDPNAVKFTEMYFAKIDGVWKMVIPDLSPGIPKQ